MLQKLPFLWAERCTSFRAVDNPSSDALLRQFGHRKLHVPTVVGHVTVVGAEFRVFETVAAHPGVLVIDGVDEEEDDGDGDHRDGHESSDERKVVLCKGISPTL